MYNNQFTLFPKKMQEQRTLFAYIFNSGSLVEPLADLWLHVSARPKMVFLIKVVWSGRNYEGGGAARRGGGGGGGGVGLGGFSVFL